jgi:hypothetical protein
MNRIIIIASIIIASLVFLSPHWLGADDDAEPPKTKVATATVLPEKCVFTFPIDNIEREWKWGVNPAHHCEYSWMVTVKNNGATYQFGFSYFNPDAFPQSGTFDKLLKTGQANVWRLEADGNGASYVDGVRVNCDSKGNALRITINNEKWVKKLFGRAPKTVRFETSGAQLKASKVDVNVEYTTDSRK